ncbi:MAG: hypothetical protein N3G21_11395 [Candidatus Hydrogenedentes bacterium]|nr:hypothetical protein [Candidatus Hydrogenedentota bacterium]
MGNINRYKVFRSLLIFICSFLQLIASSDGGVFVSVKDDPFLHLADENWQVAYINYVNGVEHMIISVTTNLELDGGKEIKDAFWIFPIPAEPDDVNIDIVKDFKMPYKGINIRRRVGENIQWWAGLTLTSQVFPIPIVLAFPILVKTRGGRSISGEDDLRLLSGVTEHISMEKMGLITKVITAKDADALYNYLKENGGEIQEDAKKIFQEYIGKDYSFVVSWVKNVDEYLRSLKGEKSSKRVSTLEHTLQVYVKFKTDKIYYPMLMTRLYGKKYIQISLYFAKPVVISEKDDVSLYDYNWGYFYLKGKHKIDPQYSDFYAGKDYYGDCVYTLYYWSGMAQDLPNDLWVKEGFPKGLNKWIYFNRFYWIIFGLSYMVFSALSSLLAGYISFSKETRLSNLGLMGLGLFNCLTLIGFTIAGNKILRRKRSQSWTELEAEIEKEGLKIANIYIRRFYIWFSLIFMSFMIGSAILLNEILL